MSTTITQVYYQKATVIFQNEKEKLFDFTKKIVFWNVVIILLILVIINTIGIKFLELFFGKSWENLGMFTLILSILILSKAAFNPISDIITILNINHINLIFNIHLLIINLLSFYLGYMLNSITLGILFVSVFGGLSYIFLLNFCLKKLKKFKLK